MRPEERHYPSPSSRFLRVDSRATGRDPNGVRNRRGPVAGEKPQVKGKRDDITDHDNFGISGIRIGRSYPGPTLGERCARLKGRPVNSPYRAPEELKRVLIIRRERVGWVSGERILMRI